jgi:Na+/H+ antiporter NhaB
MAIVTFYLRVKNVEISHLLLGLLIFILFQKCKIKDLGSTQPLEVLKRMVKTKIKTTT